jgi:hypothetical protein
MAAGCDYANAEKIWQSLFAKKNANNLYSFFYSLQDCQLVKAQTAFGGLMLTQRGHPTIPTEGADSVLA